MTAPRSRSEGTMEPTAQCRVQPSILLLILTVLVTGAGTGILCSAMLSHHWEYVTWDRGKIDSLSQNIAQDQKIKWYLNGQIGKVFLSGELPDIGGAVFWVTQPKRPSIFIVPMNGGLWSICVQVKVSESDSKKLEEVDFPQEPCTNYLTAQVIKEETGRVDWEHRMQNLAMSCALVCLIMLGSSALVGAFGVLKQQISAVLVTGVMYLLAATFAFFTLALIHLKRSQEDDCAENRTTLGMKIDGVMLSANTIRAPYLLGPASNYLQARVSTTGWSLQLCWGGVATCILVSILWILLSKVMRYYPLTSLLFSL